MNKQLLVTLLCIFIRLSTITANEYLCYKIDPTTNEKVQPTFDEYKKAFEIIRTHKFPQILAPENRAIKEALSKEEQTLLIENEKGFIQKLIESDLKIATVTTTLYEIAFFYFYLKNISDNLDFWIKMKSSWLNERMSYFYGFKSRENIIEKCKDSNFLLDILGILPNANNYEEAETFLHYNLNNFIIQFDKENPKLQRNALIQIIIEKIINLTKTIKIICDNDKTQSKLNDLSLFLNPYVLSNLTMAHIPVIQRICAIENDAIKKHCFLLLRSTNGIGNKIDWFEKPFGYAGLSYGLSFFAGAFSDATGGRPACVYAYFNLPEFKYVYAWLIHKKDLLDSKSVVSNIIWFGKDSNTGWNISTLRSLISSGENFHPRATLNESRVKLLETHGFSRKQVLEQCETFLRDNIHIIKSSDGRFYNRETNKSFGIITPVTEEMATASKLEVTTETPTNISSQPEAAPDAEILSEVLNMIEIPEQEKAEFKEIISYIHPNLLAYIKGPFKLDNTWAYENFVRADVWYWYNLRSANIRYKELSPAIQKYIDLKRLFRNPDSIAIFKEAEDKHDNQTIPTLPKN